MLATGVGQNPDPLSLVGSVGVVCSKHSPSRIEPQFGQVSENSSKPPRSEHWRVLHVDAPGSYFTNDPSHFHPEPASHSIEAVAVAGDADILAGKAARYDVNNSSPRSAVKGADVIPNRERRECSVVLSGQ